VTCPVIMDLNSIYKHFCRSQRGNRMSRRCCFYLFDFKRSRKPADRIPYAFLRRLPLQCQSWQKENTLFRHFPLLKLHIWWLLMMVNITF